MWICGAMVARLTPDQKVACSIHVRSQSLCKLNRFSEAKALFDLFQRLKKEGTKVKLDIYNDLIHWLCKEWNIEEAKGLFAAMMKRGFEVDSDRYYNLVHLLCEDGEFESALEIAKESIANGWFSSFTVIKKLVNGLVGVSKIDDAKELIRRMKK